MRATGVSHPLLEHSIPCGGGKDGHDANGPAWDPADRLYPLEVERPRDPLPVLIPKWTFVSF